MSNSGVQVVVRLRPLNDREKKHGTLPVVSASTNDKTVTVIKGTGARQARSAFAFDNVFTAFSTQEEVFATTMKPVIKDVLTGFESTVFAYGQTGTGKTHTMEGSLDHPDHYGVIPRSAEAIFERLNKDELQYESFKIMCSYLEIYNEELCDLLAAEDSSNGNSKTPMKNNKDAKDALAIMEGKNGPFCRGLSQIEVKTASDLIDLMRTAQQSRRVGETNMNKQSSRSHCIFTMRVEAKRRLEDGALFETRGKLHMVDLAGSECAKSANLDGGGGHEQVARDRERMNINRSLLTLGRVVKMLKEQSMKGGKSNSVRIPYRDSKLTRILQQALGGNSKTVIVATLSPSVTAIEESISTLNYAQAAHGIINKPVSASYMSQSTNASSMLSGSGAPANGQVGSIEKWSELETRLEYMTMQVEEAKAALARKHLQQQELVERAETAEMQKKKFEQQAEELVIKNTELTEEMERTQEKCRQVEEELCETKGELEKTTLVLHATQATEVSLTDEAKALIGALKTAMAVSDQLHALVLKSRDIDVKRRGAAQQFNTSVASLLVDVKDTLVALTEEETNHSDETNKLATIAASKEMKFVQQANSVLQAAVDSVESAVATLKSSIHDQDGIVPAVDLLMSDTFEQIGKSYTVLKKGEGALKERFQSTREQITRFGARLNELESAQSASTERAISVLKENIALSKEKTDELVSSTCRALEIAKQNRQEIRDATKETLEQWKSSLITTGNVILEQSTAQQGAMEQTLDRMKSEMNRHANIESHLTNQASLLQRGHESSAETHNAQKQLLLQTQESVEASHKQQTQLLSSFVQNLMQGVETLVQAQVSEVLHETNRGHSQFMEKNTALAENHASITSSTLETLQAANALASNIQQEAGAARENDESVIAHLGETKSVLAEIKATVECQSTDVDNFASKSRQHLQDSENLDAEDTRVLDELSSRGKECVDHMAGAFLADTSTSIVELGDTAKSVSGFARNEILVSLSSAIAEMEEPRGELMTNFARECSELEEGMETGLTVIKEKASTSSKLADELHEGVNSVAMEFKDVTTNQRETDIAKMKEAFLQSATDHLNNAGEKIVTSQDGSTKAALMADLFVRTDLSAYEEVENAPEHTQVPFSEKLSSTPAEKALLASMNKLGSGNTKIGKVLQDLSPNEDKVSTRSSKLSRKSHMRSIGNLSENIAHERNEPRSERLS